MSLDYKEETGAHPAVLGDESAQGALRWAHRGLQSPTRPPCCLVHRPGMGLSQQAQIPPHFRGYLVGLDSLGWKWHEKHRVAAAAALAAPDAPQQCSPATPPKIQRRHHQLSSLPRCRLCPPYPACLDLSWILP